jgi:hypothetical protein
MCGGLDLIHELKFDEYSDVIPGFFFLAIIRVAN